MREIKLGIVGASGLVGKSMLEVLENSDLSISNLYLFTSKRSSGEVFHFRNSFYKFETLNEASFNREIDYCLFATPSEISKLYVPAAIKKGIKVIDNSSYFRKTNPLIAYGVNDDEITNVDFLITNPNCCTIQSTLALAPINKLFKLKKVFYTTFQATSGSGIKGILDLSSGRTDYYNRPIKNNLIPMIGKLNDNSLTDEEEKLISETKKIFNNDRLKVSATCVRVSVLNGHSININITCEEEVDLEKLKQFYNESKYYKYYEDDYPTPREVSGSDLVHIARLRYDFNSRKHISLFVVADNLRVGAATNAVRILSKLAKESRVDV